MTAMTSIGQLQSVISKGLKKSNTVEGFGSLGSITEDTRTNQILMFVVAMFITFVVFPLAIFFTIRCGDIKKWSPLVQTVIIFSFLTPYVGIFAMMAMVVYGLMLCSRKK